MTRLQGETIIYFGPEPWAGLWRNRHQLMSRLAVHNDVWYVEPPAPIRDVLALKRRNSRLFSRDASGVNVFHGPWWLPVTGRAPFKDPSIRLLLFALSRVAGTGRNRRPIVWLSRPDMVDYLGKTGAKLTVYHVVDEYSGYGHPSRQAQPAPNAKEVTLLENADIVVVVTPTLFDLKAPYNDSTHIVPNAADFEAYAGTDPTVPGDMAGISGPIIGYSGLIAARLDLELLRRAAEERPAWDFVFVGTVNDRDCKPGLQALRELPNVHFLGNKAVQDVPRYVRRFDVCIIPYVLNLRAQHAGPLKLYEYAAASRPIVATDFAAARAFEGHVSIAGDAEQFVLACERSLTMDAADPEIAGNRRIASENTWNRRVEQLSDIITKAMA